AQLSQEDPENLLNRLAKLDGGNVLVASEPSFLKDQLAAEKQDALVAPENMVEKHIALLEKPKILAQIEQTRSTFDTLQQQMLGTETAGVEQWGTAMIRDGEVRRIQDYPLEDPAVAVWDNDIFLGYEKALYLKTIDGKPRRHAAYDGRVQQVSLDEFQRTAVPHLQVRPVSGEENGLGSATVRWTWQSAADVELTVWDSVGKAQRLDSRHLRFYLHQTNEPATEYFQALNPGISLQEGQQMLARQSVRLRFGEDLLIIPAGMSFTLPSLVTRSVQVNGDGTVALENFSGQAWSVFLAGESSLEMGGVAELQATGSREVRIPAFTQRPFVSRILDGTEGALRSRVEVVAGDRIPAGEFYVTRAGRLVKEGLEMDLQPGMVFKVSSNEHWQLVSGRGEVVVSDDLEYTEG